MSRELLRSRMRVGRRALCVGVLVGATSLASTVRSNDVESRSEPLADPTRPPAAALLPADPPEATESKKPDALALHAILHAGDRRLAVLNGQQVAEGGRIGGAEVLAIEADRVRLRRDGETIELLLVSPAFRKAREGATR